MSNDPGVWLSAVRDGPHLQGRDHPGQEQESVQGTLHCLFQRTWQTKGTDNINLSKSVTESAQLTSLTAVWA